MTVARESQLVVEVVRLNQDNKIRTSQVVLEVVRPNAAAAPTARPQVFTMT